MKGFVFAILTIVSLQAQSQFLPPPVNINIQNISQQTQVWCWAAVAQQIIRYSRGPSQTPPQCALVAMANGVHPNFCCSGMGNPSCVTTGSMQQIQYLIAQFGGSYSSLAPPTDYMTLYNTLASGRPIILHVASGAMSSHVVVLTGMSFHPSYGAVLHINDPLAYYNQPIPYSALIPIWIEALVVN